MSKWVYGGILGFVLFAFVTYELIEHNQIVYAFVYGIYTGVCAYVAISAWNDRI